MPDLDGMSFDDHFNQACAEIAFARSMGWADWTPDKETEPGMVRGYHVRWHAEPGIGFWVPDDDDDDARYVLVTGRVPRFEVHGWITAGEAKRVGRRIGEG